VFTLKPNPSLWWAWDLIAGLSLVWIALPGLAVVNGAVITQEDFNRKMSGARQHLLSKGNEEKD
jgi:hypothetical protein